MGLPNPQTSARRIEARENALKALEYRRDGMSFDKIARVLGYKDESGARKAVKTLLDKREYEGVEETRKIMRERWNDMRVTLMPKMLAGNFGAIDRLLKIDEMEAKLLGLNSAEKHDFTSDGKPLAINYIKVEGRQASAPDMPAVEDEPADDAA